MELKLPLLVYDAQCPLCVRFKQGLERLDVNQRVCYVALSESEVFARYPQLNAADCASQIHYVREDGAVLVGGEVITELLKHFPAVGKLAWLLETEVGKKAVNFFYQQVENLRQKIKADEESCPTCREP